MTGLKISKRSDIASFLALDVLKAANEREAAGGDILHMEIGEPCSGPPPAVNDAAARALRNGWTGYTEALGTAELRERIARDYRERHDLDVAPGQVIITTGSSAGFILSFLATFDVGDRVIIAEPGYPAYPKLLSALGIEPVVVHVGIEQDFKLTPALLEQALEKHGPVQGVLIASPANPTGTMLDEEELSAIVDFCRDARLRLISDEIYQDITFDRPAATALEYWDEAIVINSFSKYYRMTGWRIGWMVAPRALVRPIERLAQSFFISPPAVSQHAAVVAMDCGEELDKQVAVYARNRDCLLGVFDKIGIRRRAPADGAFYLYADVSDFTDDSLVFCRRMLSETGIAATPGADFDARSGHHYVRFSFAGHETEIREAADRLTRWLAGGK